MPYYKPKYTIKHHNTLVDNTPKSIKKGDTSHVIGLDETTMRLFDAKVIRNS